MSMFGLIFEESEKIRFQAELEGWKSKIEIN